MNAEGETTPVLIQAWAAFVRSDWDVARDLFERAHEEEPSAEALDGLGQVLWWLGEEEEAIETRAKAFGEYRRRGDAVEAANIAIYLAAEYRIAGNSSLSNGWLGRGTRLLDDCGDCPARVWLHIERSKRAPTPEVAEEEARHALELARAIDDAGLEGAALSHAGRAMITGGDEESGMGLLDEAMAIATSAEAEDPMAIGDACCTTLIACERLYDPRRALDWGRAISEFFRRRRFLPLLSWCRSVYAGFLIATGNWEDAETHPRGGARGGGNAAPPQPRRDADPARRTAAPSGTRRGSRAVASRPRGPPHRVTAGGATPACPRQGRARIRDSRPPAGGDCRGRGAGTGASTRAASRGRHRPRRRPRGQEDDRCGCRCRGGGRP